MGLSVVWSAMRTMAKLVQMWPLAASLYVFTAEITPRRLFQTRFTS